MEMILLIGIPASGKSSFYKNCFFGTHMRVSLDLYNTRNKEERFLKLAFDVHQRLVIDNTNVLKSERANYILNAKANKFKVIGYYFESKLSACMERNDQRSGKEKISKVGILAKHKALELPNYEEGFDELWYVTIEESQFKINEWKDEI